MTNKFRDFLKEHNAYDAFIKNKNGEPSNDCVFIDSFQWILSPEGFEYWNNLDNLWYDVLVEEDKYDL